MKKSASDLLKSVAKSPETKSPSSDIPELRGHEPLADTLHIAIIEQKKAESDRKIAEGDLIGEVEEVYVRNAKSGRFSKSINVPGYATPGVQITFQDRFSPIPIEHEDEMRRADPNFDAHFEQRRTVKLKDSSKEVIALLIKKLGNNITDLFDIQLRDTSDKAIELLGGKFGDEFANLFEVELQLVAKEHLDEKLHEIPQKIWGFVKQAKGSVKLRTAK